MTKYGFGDQVPPPSVCNAPFVAPLPPGTTLRDWFAGQAMAGILAHANVAPLEGETEKEWRLRWAGFFYDWADAMLAARETEGARDE